MSKSILIHENGGPEKMQLADVEVGSPGPGQVKIRHTAIGLNFIDIYTRSGLYQTPLPNAVGREAAGVIVEVGPKTKGFKKGDRVAYCMVRGAYAEAANIPAWHAVKLPEGISDEIAAAALLKGLTARRRRGRQPTPIGPALAGWAPKSPAPRTALWGSSCSRKWRGPERD